MITWPLIIVLALAALAAIGSDMSPAAILASAISLLLTAYLISAVSRLHQIADDLRALRDDIADDLRRRRDSDPAETARKLSILKGSHKPPLTKQVTCRACNALLEVPSDGQKYTCPSCSTPL